MEQTDQFGEPIAPTQGADLSHHIDVVAHTRLVSYMRACFAALFLTVGPAVCYSRCQEKDAAVTVFGVGGVLLALHALRISVKMNYSRRELAEWALKDPKALRRALCKCLDACPASCAETEKREAVAMAFAEIAGRTPPPAPDADYSAHPDPRPAPVTIVTGDRSAAQDASEDAVDPWDIVPAELRTAWNSPRNLEVCNHLALLIRNAPTVEMPRLRVRPLIVDAFVLNERMRPVIEAELRINRGGTEVTEEYHRFRQSLVELYDSCMWSRDSPDQCGMHDAIEDDFRLHVAGNGDVDDVLLRHMDAEACLVSERRRTRMARSLSGRTPEEQDTLDELERHAAALKTYCAQAWAMKIDALREMSPADA